ncbi:MAG: hypothetical protein V4699_01985 [Patescibacteria group bacterium]
MKNTNIFLVGTGLIGSTLLRQIQEQKKQEKLAIHIAGLANIDSMLFANKGDILQNWEQKLKKGQSVDLKVFVRQMIAMNLEWSVFIDCTASESIVALYPSILNAGIAIITPNKKANSGALKTYKKLKELSKKNNVPFIYEANVGAGLPIIHSVQGLVKSGDEVLEIQAILSGTLSYIFNTFSNGKDKNTFSNIVKDAQKKGYTEPDPRNDLNGMDFGRKMLILGREIGLPMELRQVRVEQLLPAECMNAKSVPEFFTTLAKFDKDFEERKIKAQKNNKVLRYIGKLKNGQASISLQEVDSTHPFFAMSGSDNIISIKTKRYNDTPLVIKGPGAGAEVTAGGLLASIIRIMK